MEIANDVQVAAVACPAQRLVVAYVQLDTNSMQIADDLEVALVGRPTQQIPQQMDHPTSCDARAQI